MDPLFGAEFVLDREGETSSESLESREDQREGLSLVVAQEEVLGPVEEGRVVPLRMFARCCSRFEPSQSLESVQHCRRGLFPYSRAIVLDCSDLEGSHLFRHVGLFVRSKCFHVERSEILVADLAQRIQVLDRPDVVRREEARLSAGLVSLESCLKIAAQKVIEGELGVDVAGRGEKFGLDLRLDPSGPRCQGVNDEGPVEFTDRPIGSGVLEVGQH